MNELKTFIAPYLTADLFAIIYLIAGVLFIFGLKGLSHPSTARAGNYRGMAGMAIAIIATIFHPDVTDYGWMLAGLALGAAVGIPVALRVAMTSMPELVALLNSFGGLAAALIALAVVFSGLDSHSTGDMVEIFLGALIGAVTFSGSIVAFGKLQGKFFKNPINFKGQQLFNLAYLLVTIGVGIYFAMNADTTAFMVMIALALMLGILIVIPIGGADMPVVVSMLNSYSGWAAAVTGFAMNNMLLVIAGAMIGASGAILSYIMCKAMNRSFFNVIIGGMGAEDEGSGEKAAAMEKGVKDAAVEDMAFMLENAENVIIVPGYGMAVAQAQHAIKEVTEQLQAKGVNVRFAIHPVAGRMPGHMNVLLAEADVPYDYIEEMDNINSDFPQADVAIVVGANDVVNPDAKEDPSSPLFGMPILEAYKSKMVYVVKRSMRSGYAGVENTLFFNDNTYMVFGDAKDVAERLGQALKG